MAARSLFMTDLIKNNSMIIKGFCIRQSEAHVVWIGYIQLQNPGSIGSAAILSYNLCISDTTITTTPNAKRYHTKGRKSFVRT
jgi:hypothetical protein